MGCLHGHASSCVLWWCACDPVCVSLSAWLVYMCVFVVCGRVCWSGVTVSVVIVAARHASRHVCVCVCVCVCVSVCVYVCAPYACVHVGPWDDVQCVRCPSVCVCLVCVCVCVSLCVVLCVYGVWCGVRACV